jgi:hypothetical protein
MTLAKVLQGGPGFMTEPRLIRRENLVLFLLALLVLVLHLSVINRYGWFRDELYYVASTDHPSFGYVDHPPLSIAILASVRTLLGDSLFAVRLLPALCSALLVILTGIIVRNFGGRRFAEALAGLAVIFSIYLALFHFYSMNFLEVIFWALAAYILIRILRGGSPRLWVLLGVVLGLGLMNKISTLWLGVGLFVGLLLTHHRRHLSTRWPWAAGILALVIFSPYLIWQLKHGWPTLEFILNATEYKMVGVGPGEFLLNQLFVMNPLNAPIWIIGFLYCMFSREHGNWRIFGWIFLTVVAILLISGESRASYLSPAYPPILASGAVAIERFVERRRWNWLKPVAVVILLAGGLVFVPLGLPILSPEAYIAHTTRLGMSPPAEERSEQSELPQHYADMFGWEEMVETVARVYESLPPEDRLKCRIFAQNYGEAGAIDVLGRRYGLPKALCGHNSYWFWGPGDWSGELMIIIGGDLEDHLESLEEVAPADTIRSRYAMPYENNLPVFVGRRLRRSVEEIWEQVRFFI